MDYHDLLCFCEEIARVAVQLHFAKRSDRDELFGDDFRWVKQVESEGLLVFFIDYLDTQLNCRLSVEYASFERENKHSLPIQETFLP
jgi:hypothetical protein